MEESMRKKRNIWQWINRIHDFLVITGLMITKRETIVKRVETLIDIEVEFGEDDQSQGYYDKVKEMMDFIDSNKKPKQQPQFCNWQSSISRSADFDVPVVMHLDESRDDIEEHGGGGGGGDRANDNINEHDLAEEQARVDVCDKTSVNLEDPFDGINDNGCSGDGDRLYDKIDNHDFADRQARVSVRDVTSANSENKSTDIIIGSEYWCGSDGDLANNEIDEHDLADEQARVDAHDITSANLEKNSNDTIIGSEHCGDGWNSTEQEIGNSFSAEKSKFGSIEFGATDDSINATTIPISTGNQCNSMEENSALAIHCDADKSAVGIAVCVVDNKHSRNIDEESKSFRCYIVLNSKCLTRITFRDANIRAVGSVACVQLKKQPRFIWLVPWKRVIYCPWQKEYFERLNREEMSQVKNPPPEYVA